MKVSYNWLRTYVPHELGPQELAERLTMAGLEVESVDEIGASLEGVVVGHVVDVRRHPNADRLTLCRVDVGGEAPLQIACGAPNVAAGQKVPVATIGTTLHLPGRENPEERAPFTIDRVKLRGEISEGMICSESELALSDDHSGIMVLDEEASTGQPFDRYLRNRGVAARDAILDVSITPNRPDAVSHIGIARDVAALEGLPLLRPEVALPHPGGEAADAFRVDIEAPAACPRYVGILVREVRVGESPEWLKSRLTAIGLRPRNNIVDITNFVLYECGQPLHAFDFDQLADRRIVVRQTKGEQFFTTLDSKQRKLPPGTLMICDGEREVAIAGIMGGENSEVTDGTTNVLIESAYFDPSTIRRAAKALGMHTDASYRFERGVDAGGQVWAAARAAEMMAELAGGTIVPGVIDAHPRPAARREILLRPARVSALLGVTVPAEEILRLLTSIGFDVEREDPLDAIAENLMEGRGAAVSEVDFALRCIVPSFRPDVEREVDLIEEVARLYGYDRIPEPDQIAIPAAIARELPEETCRRSARALLSGIGFREIYTNSLLPREAAAFFADSMPSEGDGGVVETLNPISQEMAALRPSLLHGMLQVMRHNQMHGQRMLRFIEFGHVFRRTDRDHTIVPGYSEHESFIIGQSGLRTEVGWDEEERPTDFFDLKGAVVQLLATLGISGVDTVEDYETTPVVAYQLTATAGNVALGIVARLADDVAERYELRDPVYFAELDWQAIVRLAAPQLDRKYEAISRFPVVERDLAMVVDRDRPVGPLMKAIRESGGSLLRHVGLFDLYEGEGVAVGRKSVAFRLRFGADRTLQDEEVDARIEEIVRHLSEEYGAALRG